MNKIEFHDKIGFQRLYADIKKEVYELYDSYPQVYELYDSYPYEDRENDINYHCKRAHDICNKILRILSGHDIRYARYLLNICIEEIEHSRYSIEEETKEEDVNKDTKTEVEEKTPIVNNTTE